MSTTRTDAATTARAAMNEDDLRRALIEASPEYVAENAARADWWRRYLLAEARGFINEAVYAYERASSHRSRMTEMTAPNADRDAQAAA